MQFKSLEDKCRYYQSLSDYRLTPNSFVVCHIDGRSFSNLIKNKFNKPFDSDFINMMNKTAEYLCHEVQGVKCAYVQSDEISLILSDLTNNGLGTFFFEGRLCKMQSIIASLATAKFNQLMTIYELNKNLTAYDITPSEAVNVVYDMKLCQFDCKCWNVPNENEAYAWMLFRQHDCIRNSKQQAAQTYLSHKTLAGKNTDEQIYLLNEKHGIDWNSVYSDGMKYGRFVTKIETGYYDDIHKTQYIRSSWKATDAPIFDTFKDTIFEIFNK